MNFETFEFLHFIKPRQCEKTELSHRLILKHT